MASYNIQKPAGIFTPAGCLLLCLLLFPWILDGCFSPWVISPRIIVVEVEETGVLLSCLIINKTVANNVLTSFI